MSNRAWMPLHIADYLADTGHLTVTEHGAYMLLIMAYWQRGGLPEDERMIARMARMTPDQWAESRDVLADLFEDGWRHKRIDAELAKADEIIEKRKNAASAMHKRRKQDAHAVQVQSTCSDTRVPPITDNLSSSLRSEDRTRNRASSVPHGFDDFWAMFPNKVGKGAAVKAFSAAIKRTDIETMLQGLAAYAAKQDDRPWCNPATWLNQDRWNDVPAQVVPLQRAASPPRNGNGKRNWIDALEAIENGTEQHQAPSRIGHVQPVPAIGRGR